MDEEKEETYLFYLKRHDDGNRTLKICRYQSAELIDTSVVIQDIDGFFGFCQYRLSHIRNGKAFYRLTKSEFIEIILRYG